MARKSVQKSIEEQYNSIFKSHGYNPEECHIVTFTPPAGTVEALHFRMMLLNMHYVFFDKNTDTITVGLAPYQKPENFKQRLYELYQRK